MGSPVAPAVFGKLLCGRTRSPLPCAIAVASLHRVSPQSCSISPDQRLPRAPAVSHGYRSMRLPENRPAFPASLPLPAIVDQAEAGSAASPQPSSVLDHADSSKPPLAGSRCYCEGELVVEILYAPAPQNPLSPAAPVHLAPQLSSSNPSF